MTAREEDNASSLCHSSSLLAEMASSAEGGGGAVDVSIALPLGIGDAFRHVRDAKIFAMDIGGSLAKIAYYSTVPSK